MSKQLKTVPQSDNRINHALGLAAGIEALAKDAVGLDDPVVDLYLALAYDSLRRLINEIERPETVRSALSAQEQSSGL